MTTHIVLPDPHSHPDHNNDRATWMGRLIRDVKPDVVINIGDTADLPSLSTYDKGKASFVANNYQRDIDAHLDFQEKLWAPLRSSKKRLPHRVFLEGNHEHRIKRVLDISPEYAGDRYGISFSDLDLKYNYNEIVEYEGGTPGVIDIDDVLYAHYFVSGVMGRPIGGVHQAASLISKSLKSCVMGHTHTTDFAVRTTPQGQHVMGLVAGVGQDYWSSWAGNINHLWWRGVIVLRNVENGTFDPQWISMKALKEEYDNDI